jgi:hypothetical protein
VLIRCGHTSVADLHRNPLQKYWYKGYPSRHPFANENPPKNNSSAVLAELCKFCDASPEQGRHMADWRHALSWKTVCRGLFRVSLSRTCKLIR